MLYNYRKIRINFLKLICVLGSTRLVAGNLNLHFFSLSFGANLIPNLNRRNQDLQTWNILPDLFPLGISFQSPVQSSNLPGPV
jgi:hypothetical protein